MVCLKVICETMDLVIISKSCLNKDIESRHITAKISPILSVGDSLGLMAFLLILDKNLLALHSDNTFCYNYAAVSLSKPKTCCQCQQHLLQCNVKYPEELYSLIPYCTLALCVRTLYIHVFLYMLLCAL